MGIVIGILKTVGVILLIILAVLLLILCLILFVPVRYRARGEIPAEGKPHGIIRLTWFFSFLSYSLEYDTGKYEKNYLSQLKICGFRFRMKQKVPKAAAADEKKSVPGGDDAGKSAEEEKKPENEGQRSGEAVQKVQKLQEKDTGKERSAQGREDGSCKGEEQKGEEIKGKK